MAPKNALVVIDMSVEQVANISYRKREVIETIRRLATSTSFDLIIDSHLWIGPNDDSSLRKLYSVGQMGSEEARLIPELRNVLGDNISADATSSDDDQTKTEDAKRPRQFVRKYNYSSFAQPSRLNDVLRAHQITDVYLCGINTDYCVFATAMDAFYESYNVFVVEEGVTSVCGAAGHRQGLEQINKFGCAKIVSVDDIMK